MTSPFELHPQLEKDSLWLGNYPLCMLRLLNTDQYPWFLLIPRRMEAQGWLGELYQLAPPDLAQWLVESMDLSRHLANYFQADKLNIASIGNRVPQLHIHHVVRFVNDPAWPGVVWGTPMGQPVAKEQWQQILTGFLPGLKAGFNAAPAPFCV